MKRILIFIIMLAIAAAAMYSIASRRILTEDQPENIAIAHAMGGIDGFQYSNSLEAFRDSYLLGFRLIEADFSYTSDGEIVLWHDWASDKINIATPKGTIPTADEFADMKIYDRYTSLSLSDLFELMKAYPQFYLISDTKESDPDTAATQFRQIVSEAYASDALHVLERWIVQVYSPEMYQAVSEVYPFSNYILTLYKAFDQPPTLEELDTLADFCHDNRILGITMPYKYWNVEYTSVFEKYDIYSAVHTVNSPELAAALFTDGVDMIYTDFLSSTGT